MAGPQRSPQSTDVAQPGQAARRKSSIQSKHEIPAESEQETEPEENMVVELQPSRKRTRRAQPTDNEPQELEDSDEYEEMVAMKKPRAVKKQVRKGKDKPPSSNDHVVLADEKDSSLSFYMAYYPGSNIRAIRVLEIDLDAAKMDDYAEYRLAIALQELHPDVDGMNPHDLQAIKIVVKGSLLFTRYSYNLASPAMSDDVSVDLKKFIAGSLTEQEKARLPFKLNSTEKVIAKALLGIRGVKQVSIEGRGKMEGNFAETLKATVVQPPGTDIVESTDPELPNSTFRLNRKGVIESEAYAQKARGPYPTRSSTFKHDFSSLGNTDRYLVDEKSQLVAHALSPEDEDNLSAFATSSRPARRQLREFHVSDVAETRGTNARRQDYDQDNSFGLHNMIRIKAREQDVEDGGLSKAWEEAEDVELPLVLTGKGGTVELGWKV